MKFRLVESLESTLPSSIKEEANKICAKYSGWFTPAEFSKMWDELSNIGIDIEVVGTPNKIDDDGTKEWDCILIYNGKQQYDCFFVYSIKEGEHSEKNEYNCYIS